MGGHVIVLWTDSQINTTLMFMYVWSVWGLDPIQFFSFWPFTSQPYPSLNQFAHLCPLRQQSSILVKLWFYVFIYQVCMHDELVYFGNKISKNYPPNLIRSQDRVNLPCVKCHVWFWAIKKIFFVCSYSYLFFLAQFHSSFVVIIGKLHGGKRYFLLVSELRFVNLLTIFSDQSRPPCHFRRLSHHMKENTNQYNMS